MRLHPHNVSVDAWAAIRALVLTLIVAYQPSSDVLAQRLTAAARYVVWAVSILKAPIVANDLFQRNSIRKYVQKHYSPGHSQTTIESRLNALALVAAGMHVARPQRTGNPMVDHYTPRQLADIRAWASSRPVDRRAETAAVVALAGGAGLRSIESAMLRIADIQDDNRGVMLNVSGTWPRVVPVGARWANDITSLRDARRDAEYLVLPNSRTYRSRESALRTLVYGDSDSPNLVKLRDTWVIEMLDLLPLNVLVRVAGFSSILSLTTRYQAYTNIADDSLTDAFRGVMTGANR